MRIRAADHAERLAAALVREEVPFDVRPEPNGWWLVRATMGAAPLQQVEQATRRG